jgi:hypothetical protein
MQIVELGDCSMVIMKDSEDPPWVSVGDIYREASKYNKKILVDKEDQLTFHYLEASDYVYTAGRLVLFFKDAIPSRFQIHDKVFLTTSYN